MERGPWARWVRPRSQDPCCWLEFSFHGGRNQGSVLRSSRNETDPQCVTTNSGEGEASRLQLSRSDRHCSQALSRPALCHCFRTLTSYPTKLLFGSRRRTANGPARLRISRGLRSSSGAFFRTSRADGPGAFRQLDDPLVALTSP